MKELVCEVDCARVARNIVEYGKPVVLMAKADCYGLGLTVAAAQAKYVAAYGVAFAEEGKTLRALTDKPILVTTPVWTADEIARYALTPVVQSVEDVRKLATIGADCAVHIKLDTGMGRYGVRSANELREVVREIARNPHLRPVAACTHYAAEADYVEQNKRLLTFLRELPRDIAVHTQASSTARKKGFDLLRIGLDAYRGCVRLTTRVIAVHRPKAGERLGYDGEYTVKAGETVAVLAGGYADGIGKRLKGHLIWIGGRLAPIVAVCMDVCFVATDRPCAVGDEAVILGESPDPTGQSLYETYTGLHGRIAFAYRGAE